MNVNTGELSALANLNGMEEEQLIKDGFTLVPKELEGEAAKALAGRERVMVDMKKRTPLTRWAKKVKQGRNEKCACGSGKKYKFCCGK